MIMPPPIPNMPPKNPASRAMVGKTTNALGPIKSHSSGFTPPRTKHQQNINKTSTKYHQT
jgi:hypothetical protein